MTEQEAKFIDLRKLLESRPSIRLGDIAADASADRGSLAIAVRDRYPQRLGYFSNRPPIQALTRYNFMLTESSFCLLVGNVSIVIMLGAASNEFVNPRERCVFLAIAA
ncbi:MAG TPA: hypothetical protein VMT95_05385 [Candidatus Binatia bacterium]|nr:hypothetical protein [Candidatus Binatia bacterium]